MTTGGDRPGLLLLCHGDFPGGFLDVERHAALYQKCLFLLDRLQDSAYRYRSSPDDEFTRLGLHVASRLSASIRPAGLQLSYLGMRSPDVRQAIYRAVSGGSHRVICAGASGLLMEGHGASDCLPFELKKVLRDNPALNICQARAGIEAADIAAMAGQSLEHAFTGRAGEQAVPCISPGGLEDTGVVLVCSHDYGAIGRVGPGDLDRLSTAIGGLSDLSLAACMDGGTCAAADRMRSVASMLEGRGFHAVEAGFMDFALPGVHEAASRLIDVGCTHIVALGMPSLLHRHPYSIAGPSAAVERIRRAFPGTSIVYVKPDPEPIAGHIAGLLISRVLEAERDGTCIKDSLWE